MDANGYTIKPKTDRVIEKYKARLVTKGYIQTWKINYLKTLAQIVNMDTIRNLLFLVVNYDTFLRE